SLITSFFLLSRPPPTSPLFPYTTLFRSCALIPVVRGQQHEQEEHDDGEYAERAQLACQIGVRAFLDGLRDLFHALGALAGGEHRSEEHTSELQSRGHLVCRLLLEKKKIN